MSVMTPKSAQRSAEVALSGGSQAARLILEQSHDLNIPERYGAPVAAGDETESAMALATEQWLNPEARALRPGEPTGIGKALLVRDVAEPLRTRMNVSLRRIASPLHWDLYEEQRIKVEDGFGVSPEEAVRRVRQMREGTERTGLDMYLARDERRLVGAVGRFRLPVPDRPWSRLQEVDVFPDWRGLGYGDALLSAVIGLLNDEGCSAVVVGADEDDWPVNWYRRRGFRDAARVPLTRPA
jgi:GNAT superfamily N-acetyltransferase